MLTTENTSGMILNHPVPSKQLSYKIKMLKTCGVAGKTCVAGSIVKVTPQDFLYLTRTELAEEFKETVTTQVIEKETKVKTKKPKGK